MSFSGKMISTSEIGILSLSITTPEICDLSVSVVIIIKNIKNIFSQNYILKD